MSLVLGIAHPLAVSGVWKEIRPESGPRSYGHVEDLVVGSVEKGADSRLGVDDLCVSRTNSSPELRGLVLRKMPQGELPSPPASRRPVGRIVVPDNDANHTGRDLLDRVMIRAVEHHALDAESMACEGTEARPLVCLGLLPSSRGRLGGLVQDPHWSSSGTPPRCEPRRASARRGCPLRRRTPPSCFPNPSWTRGTRKPPC